MNRSQSPDIGVGIAGPPFTCSACGYSTEDYGSFQNHVGCGCSSKGGSDISVSVAGGRGRRNQAVAVGAGPNGGSNNSVPLPPAATPKRSTRRGRGSGSRRGSGTSRSSTKRKMKDVPDVSCDEADTDMDDAQGPEKKTALLETQTKKMPVLDKETEAEDLSLENMTAAGISSETLEQENLTGEEDKTMVAPKSNDETTAYFEALSQVTLDSGISQSSDVSTVDPEIFPSTAQPWESENKEGKNNSSSEADVNLEEMSHHQPAVDDHQSELKESSAGTQESMNDADVSGKTTITCAESSWLDLVTSKMIEELNTANDQRSGKLDQNVGFFEFRVAIANELMWINSIMPRVSSVFFGKSPEVLEAMKQSHEAVKMKQQAHLPRVQKLVQQIEMFLSCSETDSMVKPELGGLLTGLGRDWDDLDNAIDMKSAYLARNEKVLKVLRDVGICEGWMSSNLRSILVASSNSAENPPQGMLQTYKNFKITVENYCRGTIQIVRDSLLSLLQDLEDTQLKTVSLTDMRSILQQALLDLDRLVLELIEKVDVRIEEIEMDFYLASVKSAVNEFIQCISEQKQLICAAAKQVHDVSMLGNKIHEIAQEMRNAGHDKVEAFQLVLAESTLKSESSKLIVQFQKQILLEMWDSFLAFLESVIPGFDSAAETYKSMMNFSKTLGLIQVPKEVIVKAPEETNGE